MQRVHVKWRRGGIVAAAGAAALLVPLLAVGPASGVPAKADVSITKTVGSIAVPIEFDPAERVVGLTGHEEWTRDGLHVWTEGWTSEDKVYEHVTTSTPLAAAGEPTLDYTAISGSIPPGYRLKVDITGDGVSDGVLIGEPTYYGNRWWLSSTSSYDFKRAAPSCNGLHRVGTWASIDLVTNGDCTGGNGSAWHGTLDQWRAKFPSATVVAYGFGLGSGVLGDGIISGLSFAGVHYDLTRSYSPSRSAAPGETLEYKLVVKNANDAGLTAADVVISDTLPSDLTYVPDTLDDNGNACAFDSAGKVLTCHPGSFPPGVTAVVYFQAKLSTTITSNGLPTTTGHNVTVSKQETFADLPAHQTKTFTTLCPTGYTATDGSLLIDAVDQGGYYSDIVTTSSRPNGTNTGWTVKATNFGDARAQGKVHVTCLVETLGSSGGHTHGLEFAPAVTVVDGWSNASGDNGRTVTLTCSAGRPVAPGFSVTNGLLTVRESYAHSATKWRFVVDNEDSTDAEFSVRCLKPETTEVNGHRATIAFSDALTTVTIGADSRGEGQLTCPGTAHAVVGGYAGYSADLRSLGKEPRGTTYMFRFHNEDWDASQMADLLVTCVGVRTAEEATFYTVTNTATVTTSTLESMTADNSSSAVVKIVGDPPPFAVVVGSTGKRTLKPNGKTKSVDLQVKCVAPCTFNAKVYDGSTVVANANKSLGGAPGFKTVKVKTTSAGKNLGNGDVVVKVTTSEGSESYDVTLSGLS